MTFLLIVIGVVFSLAIIFFMVRIDADKENTEIILFFGIGCKTQIGFRKISKCN
jgi:hypothetical protein